MASRATIGHLEPQGHGIHVVFLVYGAEVVLPTDLEYRSPKIKGYDESSN
jgi:hypothetical protein